MLRLIPQNLFNYGVLVGYLIMSFHHREVKGNLSGYQKFKTTQQTILGSGNVSFWFPERSLLVIQESFLT